MASILWRSCLTVINTKTMTLTKPLLGIFTVLSCSLLLLACTNTSPSDTASDTKATEVLAPPSTLTSFGTQPTSPQDPLIRRYTGNIGDTRSISMQLVNWGDGFLSGRLFDAEGHLIDLVQGEMNLDETVELQLIKEGKVIEEFRFPYTDLDQIRGTWRKGSSGPTKDFSLQAVLPSADQPQSWSGTWFLNGIWDGGELLIGDVRDTAFYFALSILRNTHSGVLDGEARISGDSAIYHRPVDFAFDEDSCALYFFLKEDHIELDQRSSPSSCGFGMRAYANGRYDNKPIELQPELSYGDSSATFQDKTQHDAFKAWIGEANYLQVAGNMQVTDPQDYRNAKEGIDGRVVEGVVMGLFTFNEAIILHDFNKGFWVATIDSENEEELLIRYFTNQPDWKKRLPQAFEKWRQSFPDYPVIYESNTNKPS